MKQNLIFIFGLFDPRDQTCFYVGLTRRGKAEPEGYIKSAHRGLTAQKVRRYLRHLFKLGFRASWDILEETTNEALEDAERFWIASFRAAGAILMNVKDGGEKGGRGYRHTDAMKQGESRRHKGKIITQEHRDAISSKLTGIPLTEEHKQKLRKPQKPGFGAKVSAGRTGVLLSDETRHRMIADGKSIGRPRTVDSVAVSCSACGDLIKMSVNDRRLRQNKNVYCDLECYKDGLKQGQYVKGPVCARNK